MITTPEITCDVFSFLDKDQIERIQLVNQFWNSVIIRHKNILSLRQLFKLYFGSNRIHLYATKEDFDRHLYSYIINVDGTNFSKSEENMSSQYSQLTVDEVLTNLNDVIFYEILILDYDSEDLWDYFLNMMKLVTTKTGGKFLGRYGECHERRLCSKLDEIFDNYIIVDELVVSADSYVREVCANPEIVRWSSTPKEIRLSYLLFKENA